MQLVHDYSPAEFRNNVMARATLGKVFKLPTILTTSLGQGPNRRGPLSRAPRHDQIEQRPGTAEAPQQKRRDREHGGAAEGRPGEPAGRAIRRHRVASAIASRATGCSRMRQWIAAANRPRPTAIHHMRS